ncbi:MAG: SDR family oxidoreductase [candidate division KSB1 bacterium]|nr:SDR family oxidoreductase [candidate division KSB1 bacterium]MDZ7386729.1 SDR family oxidoreductase [candidate division KSB1 bacterium]MDZ7393752.1 SDR family oxidoreductase [candidate division KSB1 bacterium]
MGYLEELFGLKGKVAVIIGGGGVLGGSMALALAKAGAAVAVVDLDEEKAEACAKQIVSIGAPAIALQADASSKSALEKAALAIDRAYHRLDVLINAPGINSATPFFEISEQEWEQILNVNLKSMFLACQIFGKRMLEQRQGGSIINISSASSGPPLSKVFTYSISKAGVNNLTQFLAREWAPHRIRVNAIAPGFFPAEQNRRLLTKERTEAILRHTPMGRFGEPDELAGVVLWLASERASSFVTGAIIRVDGGFSAMTI